MYARSDEPRDVSHVDEEPRRAQPHFVGVLCGIRSLPSRLDADDGIGIQLPAAAGAHRAGKAAGYREYAHAL